MYEIAVTVGVAAAAALAFAINGMLRNEAKTSSGGIVDYFFS